MTMIETDDEPLKIKLTSVSHSNGTVTHHVVLGIEGARVVFDRPEKHEVLKAADEYLRQLAETGCARLRSLL